MKLFFFILHTFTGCKDFDYKYHGRQGTCKKCGRKYFMWED